MAHDVQTKAAAFVLFGLTQGISEVARSLKIPKGTVQDWHEEWQEQSHQSTFELKKQKFAESMGDFGIATAKMLIAQAEMLSDPAYVKNLKTDEVIQHTGFIRDTLIALNAATSYIESAALPERSAAIEGIPVEE